MNCLHFAIVLFAICCAVLGGVSLLTAPPRPEQVDGLTFGGPAGVATEPRSAHHALTVWLSVALAATVAAIWLTFRG